MSHNMASHAQPKRMTAQPQLCSCGPLPAQLSMQHNDISLCSLGSQGGQSTLLILRQGGEERADIAIGLHLRKAVRHFPADALCHGLHCQHCPQHLHATIHFKRRDKARPGGIASVKVGGRAASWCAKSVSDKTNISRLRSTSDHITCMQSSVAR